MRLPLEDARVHERGLGTRNPSVASPETDKTDALQILDDACGGGANIETTTDDEAVTKHSANDGPIDSDSETIWSDDPDDDAMWKTIDEWEAQSQL